MKENLATVPALIPWHPVSLCTFTRAAERLQTQPLYIPLYSYIDNPQLRIPTNQYLFKSVKPGPCSDFLCKIFTPPFQKLVVKTTVHVLCGTQYKLK